VRGPFVRKLRQLALMLRGQAGIAPAARGRARRRE
jgi:hypothetical protein